MWGSSSGKGPPTVPDHARLHAALAEFVRTMVRDYDIGHTLDLLSDHVASILGIHGAGVSLAEDDEAEGLQFVTATDERIARVEQLQSRLGEGPCHEAHATREAVLVDDLRTADQWGLFTPGALDAGMAAVAGIPMAVGADCIGALNLYHTQPHPWTDEDVAVARLLADMATGYILHAQKLQESQLLAEQLQHALDSRVVIEQAKGMIAARNGLDVNEAFGLLRGYARANNRRLHDAARGVVAGTVEL